MLSLNIHYETQMKQREGTGEQLISNGDGAVVYWNPLLLTLKVWCSAAHWRKGKTDQLSLEPVKTAANFVTASEMKNCPPHSETF